MSTAKTKAILVVSFGTSFPETRKRTIDAIEQAIQDAYPEYTVYRAWTSKMIIRKLMRTENLHINNVKEAMEAMLADGITDIIVQPTHVINGIENDTMKEDVSAFTDQFHSITFGDPLLTSHQDNIELIEAVAHEFCDLPETSMLVLMGHGTTHYANSIYAALDYQFKDMGHKNIYLGTVEAYPSLDPLLNAAAIRKPNNIVLAPFMIVAGDHATNDMAGSNPESWRSQFEAAGYDVTCVMKGLGEYPDVHKMFIRHVAEAR